MRGTILNQPASTFEPTEAEELAAQLNADDECGWSYKVKHDPTGRGKSLIEIFDDAGEFVGKL